MNRKGLAALIAVVGALAIGLGFYLQAQANGNNAARAYAGVGQQATIAPWAAGAVGLVLLVVAVVLFVTAPND